MPSNPTRDWIVLSGEEGHRLDGFEGFREFVAAHTAAWSRLAYVLTGGHAAAEDLMQAALLKTVRRWRTICRYEQPEAYVRRVMYHEAVSQWRRRRIVVEHPVASVPDTTAPYDADEHVRRIEVRPVSSQQVSRHGWTGQVYSCLKKRCAAVKAEILDEYVQRAVVAWLARPNILEDLSSGIGDAEVAHARAEAQRLRAELEDYNKLAEAGEIKAIEYARISRGLNEQIAEHEQRAAEAGIPPVLRGMIGPHAMRKWAELGDEVAVKWEIIRTVADVRLLRAGKGGRRPLGAHRLVWDWKLAPKSDDNAA